MKFDLVIFDMDGTTLNTIDDIAQGLNFTLREAGFPERNPEQVRHSIGGGVGNLVRKSLPESVSHEVFQNILQNFKVYYNNHLNDLTQPYPGIPELLSDLKNAGIHLAANSNKVDSAVNYLAKAHFDGLFEIALGERPDISKKPSPAGALHIMQALNISPERTLYVGDGDADIITAKNAGCHSAWVSWGYRMQEELVGLEIENAFDSVEALKAFILE